MDSTAPATPNEASDFTPPNEPSKYIRTFAKDMATVTNTPLPERPPHVEPPKDIPEPPLPKAEEVKQENFTAPKEFNEEKIDLKKSDSSGVFETNETPVAEVTEDREAILARLRSKLASHTPTALTSNESAPAIPLRTAAPNFNSPAEVVVPLPPIQKTPEPIIATYPLPDPIPVPEPTKSPSLHTYSTDFTDHLNEQKSSKFAVLAAEGDAVQSSKKDSAIGSRNHLPLIFGVAMVVIGIGAIAGAYIYSRQDTPVSTVAGVPSLIRFDESVEVKGTGQILMQAISNVAQGTSVSGNVIVTYVTTLDATTTTSSIPQPGGFLIKSLSLAAPDILLRNIDQSSTVGVIKAGNESRPFLLLKVTSYERTFAGMLAWERTMPKDLNVFYPSYTSPVTQTASSSASSTQPILISASGTEVFKDAVIANHNVRILRDSSGRSLMVYGYQSKSLLIIARDETAFTTLIGRLSGTVE